MIDPRWNEKYTEIFEVPITEGHEPEYLDHYALAHNDRGEVLISMVHGTEAHSFVVSLEYAKEIGERMICIAQEGVEQ